MGTSKHFGDGSSNPPFFGSVQESKQARIFTGCRYPGSWNGNAHLTSGKQRDARVYRPFNEVFANQGTE